jgi:hypothetical protein
VFFLRGVLIFIADDVDMNTYHCLFSKETDEWDFPLIRTGELEGSESPFSYLLARPKNKLPPAFSTMTLPSSSIYLR